MAPFLKTGQKRGSIPVLKKGLKKTKAVVKSKTARVASKKGGKAGSKTPQCIHCQKYPSTARGYARHLIKVHKSTLRADGIYLICGCSMEVVSSAIIPNHDIKCDGRQFTIHRLDQKVHPNPKCVLCESRPSTATGFAYHLRECHKHDKSTLRANGIYLVCGCGSEIRAIVSKDFHNDCDSKTFTIHEDKKSTPQCMMCKAYPSTAFGYAHHLKKHHSCTLIENGIYLLCACGKEVRSIHNDTIHTKNCDGLSFTLRIIKTNTNGRARGPRRSTRQPADVDREEVEDEEREEEEMGDGVENVEEDERVGEDGGEREDENDDEDAAVGGEEMMEMEKEDDERSEQVPNGEMSDIEEEEDDTVETRDEERHGEQRMEGDEEGVDENIDGHMDEQEEENEEMEDDDEERHGEERARDEREGMDEDDDVNVQPVEDAENEDDPEFVGHHYAVKIGDVLNGKYQVIQEIGNGRFSTVWMCKKANTDRSFAIKIGVSDQVVAYTLKEEIQLLRKIKNGDPSDPHRNKVVQLLDSFTITGSSGRHVCSVFEPQDCDVLKMIVQSKCKRIGIEKVRIVIRQALEGLNYMHTKCNMMHTDIKPENILVSVENGEVKQVKIADLGNACYTYEDCEDEIQTPEYRSPEVLFGADYSITADIWSMACVAFEMATGRYLVQGKDENGLSWEADHLMKIIKMLGPIPAKIYKKGKKWREFYNEKGQLLHGQKVESFTLMDRLLKNYKWNKDDASHFVSFLTPMLKFDHEKRATAAQCLQHAWLQPQVGRPAPAAAEEEE